MTEHPHHSLTRKITLMLVDDHFVVRMGLVASLGLEPDMQVVAECDSGEQAVELYPRHRPDVVILDGRLPVMSGAEAAAAIRQHDPSAHILMLSVRDGEEDIHRAVQAGVMGYLNKGSLREDILAAIRMVADGRPCFPPAIAAKLAAHQKRPALTPRELEVLRLIVQGQANKEIAETLHLAEVTVKLHVGNVLEKLGVQDRTQAATAAIQRGIVYLD
jgi:two-component system NarL family response regulator